MKGRRSEGMGVHDARETRGTQTESGVIAEIEIESMNRKVRRWE